MFNRIVIASILMSLLLLMSCEEAPPADIGTSGQDYYPLTVGRYWVYDVDSIYYDDFTNDSLRQQYQIKELIESVFVDGVGLENFRIEKYRRDSLNEPWLIIGTRAAAISDLRAERQEDNHRYIKMAFPLKLGKTWDCNSLNPLPEQECRITDLEVEFAQGAQSFDTTLTVLYDDLLSAISHEYKVEVYAKGLGLVYIEDKDVKTSVTGVIESGHHYTYLLVETGTGN